MKPPKINIPAMPKAAAPKRVALPVAKLNAKLGLSPGTVIQRPMLAKLTQHPDVSVRRLASTLMHMRRWGNPRTFIEHYGSNQSGSDA